jgi:hypothetical protein
VVWLHVLASVGWMAQAIALAALTATAVSATDPATALSAVSMAEHLDGHVLAPMANAAAFTGFFLALATPWGLTRHWWVLVKAAITVTLLYLGIFVLSDALHAAVEAAHSGGPRPTTLMTTGAALMAGAIAFQAWVSIAKPWGPTRWFARTRPPKLPAAPTMLLRMGVAAPTADIVIGTALGYPMPLLSLAVLITAAVHRRRSTSATRTRDTSPTPAPAA